MRRLIDKSIALMEKTGLDFTLFDKTGKVLVGKSRPFENNFQLISKSQRQGLIYFKIICDSKAYVACIEEASEPTVRLLQQYFADVQEQNGSVGQDISRYLRGKLDTRQKVELDKRLSGRQFYPVLFLVTGADKKAELTEFLDAVSLESDYVATDDNAIIFLKSASNEYTSCEEVASVMYDAIKQERKIDVKICTGGVMRDLTSLDYAVKRAYLALNASDPHVDVCNYKQYAQRTIYEEMTRDQRKAYLTFMLDGVKDVSVFSDQDMLKTASVLSECSLSVSVASKRLFVHRNTLTHRIDKIYEDCGLDLRRFDDAVIFKAIAEIYAIAKKNGEI